MRQRQQAVLATFRRVADFVAGTPDVEATVKPQLDALAGVVSRLTAYAVTQDSGRRLSVAATERNATLRRRLREEHMQPIARVAAMLFTRDPDHAGQARALRMPPARTTVTSLVAAAGAMAGAAAPHEAAFVAQGLPADFRLQLLRAAADVQATIDDRATHVKSHVGATAGIRVDIADGQRIVHVLDVLVRKTLAMDPVGLAAWTSVSRIDAHPGGTGTTVPVAGTAPDVPAATAA